MEIISNKIVSFLLAIIMLFTLTVRVKADDSYCNNYDKELYFGDFAYTLVYTSLYEDDTKSNVLFNILKGEKVQIMEREPSNNSQLVMVNYKGELGYISKTNISKIERPFRDINKLIKIRQEAMTYLDENLTVEGRKLRAGLEVYALGESDNTVKIGLDGRELYINKIDTNLSKEFIGDNKVAFVDINGENLYSSPSLESSVVRKINRTEELRQLRVNDKWSEIITSDGVVGYITTDKLNLFDYGDFTGEDVVRLAMQYIGGAYSLGGKDIIRGIDCSNFTKTIYSKFGYELLPSSASQRRYGEGVSLKDARPGDIICYDGHVAIYAGDNKIVHAASPRSGIMFGTINIGKPVLSVRRIIK